MATTRGVVHIHSAPSALCPHVEWAVGGIFAHPVQLSWAPQPVERASLRAEYAWRGPVGTAARLASALKGWQRLRFEVTEEASAGSEGVRYAYTPALGVFQTASAAAPSCTSSFSVGWRARRSVGVHCRVGSLETDVTHTRLELLCFSHENA